MRGEADADRGAGLDPLIADDDSAHVEAVDADVARGHRAEAANLVRAVEADRLVADAGPEGVVGGGDGILSGALGEGGLGECAGGEDGKGSKRKATAFQGRSPCWH